MPLLASFFLLFGLATMGLPGTSGFPAELLLLLSTFERHAGAGLAGARRHGDRRRLFPRPLSPRLFGPLTRPAVAAAEDLRPRELALMLVFAALVIAFGLFPGLLLDVMSASVEAWVARLG